MLENSRTEEPYFRDQEFEEMASKSRVEIYEYFRTIQINRMTLSDLDRLEARLAKFTGKKYEFIVGELKLLIRVKRSLI